MRDKFIRLIFLSLLSLVIGLSGCSAIVSPYNSKFQCPHTDKGKCVSVQTAYKESVGDSPAPPKSGSSTGSVEGNPLVKEKPKPCKTCGKPAGSQQKAGTNTPTSRDLEYKYQDSLYKKLASLIEQPSTPVVVPPDVVRVLILSYTGSDNDLFSYRYVYFFATEPRWIISTAKEAE